MRDGRSVVPGPYTHFVTGDQLLVVAGTDERDAAEARLRAVARGGKLARWNARARRLRGMPTGGGPVAEEETLRPSGVNRPGFSGD